MKGEEEADVSRIGFMVLRTNSIRSATTCGAAGAKLRQALSKPCQSLILITLP